MNEKELEAYLDQLRAMGMNDQMVEMYKQQIMLANAMNEQLSDESGDDGDFLSDLFGDSYEVVLEPSTNLTLPQQWAVACGADLAMLNGHALNVVAFDEDEETSREVLSEWWGIESKEELDEMIESLKAGRHSGYYSRIADAYRQGSRGAAEQYINDNLAHLVDDVEDAIDHYLNMREAMVHLETDYLIPRGGDVPNLIAWDLVRGINIARIGVGAGYYAEEEALAIVMALAKTLQKTYSSWKDLSVAYQLGRYIWGGDAQYETMRDGMKVLLSDENSPWVKLAWDTKLG